MTPTRLVIAEDDPDDRLLAAEAFATIGVEPQFAANGRELLSLVRTFRDVGVVLLDLNMPRMDGRTALARMREDPDTADIPVVVFTTSRSPVDRRDLARLGADDYVVKPDSFDGLVGLAEQIHDHWLSHSIPEQNGQDGTAP